jgi:hypothetical protein
MTKVSVAYGDPLCSNTYYPYVMLLWPSVDADDTVYIHTFSSFF